MRGITLVMAVGCLSSCIVDESRLRGTGYRDGPTPDPSDEWDGSYDGQKPDGSHDSEMMADASDGSPDALHPDGEPDGMPPDVMRPDAGPDAGPDASPDANPDALPPDGPTPDALPPDAPTPDGQMPDGAVADGPTNLPDGGLPDHETPDAFFCPACPMPDAGSDGSDGSSGDALPLDGALADGKPADGPLLPDAPICVPTGEICNGVDDDCDGEIDEGCPTCGGSNLVTNADLESVIGSEWNLNTSSPVVASLSRDCGDAQNGTCSAHVVVSTPGNGTDARVEQAGVEVAGGLHEVCFFLRTETIKNVSVLFRLSPSTIDVWSGDTGLLWDGVCRYVMLGGGSYQLWIDVDDGTTAPVWFDNVSIRDCD